MRQNKYCLLILHNRIDSVLAIYAISLPLQEANPCLDDFLPKGYNSQKKGAIFFAGTVSDLYEDRRIHLRRRICHDLPD
jgi:hypothetical protein